MEIFGLSVIGLIVSTGIGMVLGAAWYSPLLFGERWMRCINKTPETLGDSKTPMLGSIFASLLTAIGVGLIFSMTGINTLGSGVGIGLILGMLIIFPALLSDSLFCGWGNELLLIQVGYRALSVLLMSVALVFLQ